MDAIAVMNAVQAIGTRGTITTAVSVSLTAVVQTIVATGSRRSRITLRNTNPFVAMSAAAIARLQARMTIRAWNAITAAIAVTFVAVLYTIKAGQRLRPRIERRSVGWQLASRSFLVSDGWTTGYAQDNRCA